MKRRNILIVGPIGSGKTNLAMSMMKGLNAASKKEILASGCTKEALKNETLIGVQCVHIKEFESIKQLTLFAKSLKLAIVTVIFEYQGSLKEIPQSTRELFDEVIELKDSPF